MELRQFLETVVTTDSGWFVLLYCHKDTPLDKREEFFGWPDDIDDIIRRIKELAEDHQVYFSPYLFKEQSSSKVDVLPSKTIVADLDEANILYLNPQPTILVRTSPGRHQGYWILTEHAANMAKHEELSQRITYSIPRCDRGGWFLGKKVRLPETQNFKYSDGPKPVDIIRVENRRYNPLDLESLPALSDKVIATIDQESDISWMASAVQLAKTIGPIECLARASTYLPERVLAIYDKTQSDRSRALWDLEVSCVFAGATKEEIFIIAKGSANNKFADLRYGADEALAYDINRAFSKVGLEENSAAKSHIETIRYDKIPAIKKRQDMANVVTNELNEIGQFINCSDGTQWYIREDVGRPIPIMMKGSESLQILLESMFGINPTEGESSYICAHLTSLVSQLPQTGVRSTLTYFDDASQCVFLHTGRKEVLRITANDVQNLTNGYQEIIFPWNATVDPLVPIYEDSPIPWWEELFSDCFGNILSLSRSEAMSLLRAWLLTILFRNAVMTRPILALLGQPGSGKSTLCHRIYTLLYGPRRALGKVNRAEDFDMALANDPLTIFDNVDTPEKWLPDRLALAAGNSEITKRKLFTNTETISLQMQGFVGITAHNPQFGREDVADRFLLLQFERLPDGTRRAETDIINRIVRRRHAMWGAIVQDIQKVLSTPQPLDSEVPDFRIADFARMGFWISRALGDEESFASAIKNMKNDQRSFNLEEDHILVEALRGAIQKQEPEPKLERVSAAQLWQLLERASKDQKSFRAKYRNAVALGKKFWALQDSLKALFKIEWDYDTGKGARVWNIEELNTNG
jgi:hypothetical protein